MPDNDPGLSGRPANDSVQRTQTGKPTSPIKWLLLGVVLAVVVMGGGFWAYYKLAPAGGPKIIIQRQVKVDTLRAGSGPMPTRDDVTLINYKGTLRDGKVFDQAEKAVFPVEGVVPGFSQALMRMQKGGKYSIFIPSELAYGDKAAGPIPPNTDLTFEVELLDFKSRAEVEQQMQQMQQLQQQGKAPPPPPSPPPPDGKQD